MKKINKIGALTVGTLMILGFNAGNVVAQDCYDSEAMYGEGPVKNCQQRVGKVIVSDNKTAMLEEGMAIPGQDIEQNIINPALAKNALQMNGDVFSEGVINDTNKETNVIALRDKAIQTEPAAGL